MEEIVKTNEAILAYTYQLKQADTKGNIEQKGINKQELIVAQGNPNYFVYLIISGIAKCFITESNGKNFIIEFLGKGEIFGELEVIKRIPNVSSIEAMTELDVFKIRGDYFRDLLEKDAQFNQLIIEELSNRIIHTATRSAYQQIYSTENTVLKLLRLKTDDISKEDLAEYLGITVRSLNRTINTLKDKGFSI